ncbi:SAM-dependent methyltransferase [Oikeobacillus pervagus]|uniref:SAM-dependent methyltransferase n=1 Tax=Oikeobacillus pervagus TaxID=1325931 RepID=A0AAJ1T7T6_9BACI|nr:class I SAM-dependent methyltransferase [Oikeobacillus pervagus]MDQ0216726.1 SAM-dependent methyltransferase [Oikeobacillus pervagus]
MSYEQFAFVYDELMKDVPYRKWMELLKEQMNKHGIAGKKILDLACGTGEFTVQLAKEGFEVTGVDLSEDMLMVAQEKAVNQGFHIPFFQQDMRELEALGEFDCVTIFCDSLNYVGEEQDVLKTFSKVYEHLKIGGLLLFDVHSIYKIQEIFIGSTFTINDDPISYIWNCFEGEVENTVEHELTFFVLNEEDQRYERFDELHIQRTFPIQNYEKWLKKVGFQVEQISADFTNQPPTNTSQRIIYVARKAKATVLPRQASDKVRKRAVFPSEGD